MFETKTVYIETNGIRLHAVEAGDQDRKLVVLLHGFPEFWRGWVKQIGPLVEAGYRVLAPDLRGYNLSDKPEGLDAYRLVETARDVVGLIDGLGQQKAVLVGHDWGGVTAWVTAALFPRRLEKMVVLNAPYPTAGYRAILRDPSQVLRSLYILFFQLPGLPEAIMRSKDWELLVRGMRGTSLPDTFTDLDFEFYRQAWWRKGAMTAMLNWYRALIQRPSGFPWRPSLSLPILIIWGARDVALSRATAELSLQQCERGRLVFIEQAGHWVQHEQAARVNKLLLEFLTDISVE